MSDPVPARPRRKRNPMVRARSGEIVGAWGRAGDVGRGETADLQYAWGGAGAAKSDARILCQALEELPLLSGQTLRQELAERGYDLTTLRFTIRMKDPQAGA